MSSILAKRRRRRKPGIDTLEPSSPLPYAVRRLMRRYSLTPGMAAAVAAAAGLSLEAAE